ncbi:MAG TPA: YcxB family protein [Micromonosporaceae bacterium]|nr:YcxB family protein [Micromonosporaceae bacterium]
MNITFVRRADADRERRQFWAMAHYQVRVMWAVSALFVALGAGVAVLGFTERVEPFGPAGIALGVGGVWIALVPWILFRGATRRGASRAAPDITIRLTDDEAAFDSALSQARFKWPLVRRIEDRNGFWIARGERRVLFTLPQECMAAEQVAEFRAFLAHRTPPQPAHPEAQPR